MSYTRFYTQDELKVIMGHLNGSEITEQAEIPVTPRQVNIALRREIQSVCGRIADKLGIGYDEINGRVKRRYGKSRTEMSNKELTEVMQAAGDWLNRL